jgi:hypothetical protein
VKTLLQLLRVWRILRFLLRCDWGVYSSQIWWYVVIWEVFDFSKYPKFLHPQVSRLPVSILTEFNQTRIWLTDFFTKNTYNFIKIRLLGAKLFYADWQAMGLNFNSLFGTNSANRCINCHCSNRLEAIKLMSGATPHLFQQMRTSWL